VLFSTPPIPFIQTDSIARLADPTDLTIFSWEDGKFAMNFVMATKEELGGVKVEPQVGPGR
jgi:hypothetical protein